MKALVEGRGEQRASRFGRRHHAGYFVGGAGQGLFAENGQPGSGQFLRDAGVVGVGRGHINGLQTRRLHKLGEAGGAQERRIGRLHGGQRLLVEVAECHQSAIGGSGNGRGHVVAGHPAAANDAPADGSSMRNSHNQ